MDHLSYPEILAIGLAGVAMFVSLIMTIWACWVTNRIDKVLMRLALAGRLGSASDGDRCPLLFKDDPSKI